MKTATSTLRTIEFKPLFSFREDLVIFTVPTLIGAASILIVLTLIESFPQYLTVQSVATWYYRIYAVFFLVPHIYATLYKLRIDQRNHPSSYQTELKVFWIILGITGLLFLKFNFILLISITYLDMFHSVRQQYGWLALSQRRQASIDRLESLIDRIMIYNVTVAPMLWWHSVPVEFGWLQQHDLKMIFPEWVGAVILSIHWLINSCFMGFYFIRYLLGNSLNLGKILIIANSWIAYYVGIVHVQDGMKILMITFNHTMAYLFLVFRYWNKAKKEEKGAQTSDQSSKFLNWTRFYTPLLGAGLFISAMPLLKQYRQAWITQLVVFLPLCGGMFHYFFDAIVWRIRNKQTALVEYFRF